MFGEWRVFAVTLKFSSEVALHEYARPEYFGVEGGGGGAVWGYVYIRVVARPQGQEFSD